MFDQRHCSSVFHRPRRVFTLEFQMHFPHHAVDVQIDRLERRITNPVDTAERALGVILRMASISTIADSFFRVSFSEDVKGLRQRLATTAFDFQ